MLLRFDPGFPGCRCPALRLRTHKRREGFGRATQRLETEVQDLGLHVSYACLNRAEEGLQGGSTAERQAFEAARSPQAA